MESPANLHSFINIKTVHKRINIRFFQTLFHSNNFLPDMRLVLAQHRALRQNASQMLLTKRLNVLKPFVNKNEKLTGVKPVTASTLIPWKSG
mmetsp:Transcript_8812/g.26407  ORF Transcript_8812/g.26407 Transcript_8812/m.26407 type:complete len:92 (-) Transcript_8812:738-1013(-)